MKRRKPNLEVEAWFVSKVEQGDLVVSKSGSVRARRGELEFNVTSNGYLRVTYLDKNMFVHRLVYSAYNGAIDDDTLVINHLDSDKLNNRLKNLELVTAARNVQHAIAAGRLVQPRAQKHHASKLSVAQITYARKRNAVYTKPKGRGAGRFTLISDLAKELGLSTNAMRNILLCRTYASVKTEWDDLSRQAVLSRAKYPEDKSGSNAIFSDQEVKLMREVYAPGRYTLEDIHKVLLTKGINCVYLSVRSAVIGATYKTVCTPWDSACKRRYKKQRY